MRRTLKREHGPWRCGGACVYGWRWLCPVRRARRLQLPGGLFLVPRGTWQLVHAFRCPSFAAWHPLPWSQRGVLVYLERRR